MHQDKKNKTYTLSPRDLSVMQQANISFTELAGVTPKYAGLPPLWSKIAYLMLRYPDQTTSKYFWKTYRVFHDLLKTRDAHYKSRSIPKNSGGTRELLIPDWDLRHHQRFILNTILYKIPVSKHACAYHKHRGLLDLAQPHLGHKTLLHMDIQDFFHSITQQMVFQTLQEETGYPKTVAGFLAQLCCYRQHLPQGACTSPALSNICFKSCDAALADLAEKMGLTYTRYSDDLYFSGDAVDAAAVIEAVKTILAGHGFRLRTSKTRVLGKHQAQKVTAIVVNEKLQVSRSYRRQLRQELYYLERFGKNAKAARAAGDYETYLRKLLGKVAFALYVDPSNQEFLAAKDMLNEKLRKIYTPQFLRYAELENLSNHIRGCLMGGAAGDALGYPVEFLDLPLIQETYGPSGITEYALDRAKEKALISDDTQMTLFTANGLLFGATRARTRDITVPVSSYIALAYRDWYMTQTKAFAEKSADAKNSASYVSWLCYIPELYSRRAPGATCMDALSELENIIRSDYIDPAINNSKGCGGVMRVAPLAMAQWKDIDQLLEQAAQAAAITHGHPLGYMTASVLCYVLHRIVFAESFFVDLKEIVIDARDSVCEYFQKTPHVDELAEIIDRAIALSENDDSDINNIQKLGGGWVAEEALAISIYCSLRYKNDFSAAITAAVNHGGDSDSTGAITGNIVGALVGYDAIDGKWKKDLELTDVILELADDLYNNYELSAFEFSYNRDWQRKYQELK